MTLRKLRVGVDIALNIIILLGIALWPLLTLYLPLKWKHWRATSKFKRLLIEEGLPENAAKRLTDHHFKSFEIFLRGKWWKSFGWRRRRGHGG